MVALKKVRFPVYFEVCGNQELELPNGIDENDDYAVRSFIEDNWDEVPLPAEYEYVGGCTYDWESPIEIIVE